MSKLIEKLAVQSLVDHGGELIFSKEKFVELIVQECATLIPAEQSHAPDGRPLAKIFEEHFGVEQ